MGPAVCYFLFCFRLRQPSVFGLDLCVAICAYVYLPSQNMWQGVCGWCFRCLLLVLWVCAVCCSVPSPSPSTMPCCSVLWLMSPILVGSSLVSKTHAGIRCAVGYHYMTPLFLCQFRAAYARPLEGVVGMMCSKALHPGYGDWTCALRWVPVYVPVQNMT